MEDAAREAGYSYYHLNRQFSAVLGESVGSYIKKRRLSHAARELVYTERRVIGQLPHGRGFGICESCGEGNTLYTMSDDLPFSEVVSVEVSSMSVLPPPLVYKTIPGGKYAVFTHTGSLKSLPLTYQYIWGTWSLTTQEKLDGREDFELYDERFLGFYHPDSQTDIYIPVQ